LCSQFKEKEKKTRNAKIYQDENCVANISLLFFISAALLDQIEFDNLVFDSNNILMLVVIVKIK